MLAAPTEVDAHHLIAVVRHGRRLGQLAQDVVKLRHVPGTRRSVVLPAVHINHEERFGFTVNNVDRALELVAIPEVALFVKLDVS